MYKVLQCKGIHFEKALNHLWNKFQPYEPAAGEKFLKILSISGCSEAIWQRF